MRRIILPLVGVAGLAATQLGSAIDVNPSKNTIPTSSFDTGGNSFSIFNGDPKRIQRANEVNTKMFDAKVQVSPNPLSLHVVHVAGPNPSIKVTFFIHNHGKKTYTLSFPTSQRWDFRLLDANGAVVYNYTDDHAFVPVIGTSMVNEDDKLAYSETVEFNDMNMPLTPGTYTIEAVMANYPDMRAKAQFVVQD